MHNILMDNYKRKSKAKTANNFQTNSFLRGVENMTQPSALSVAESNLKSDNAYERPTKSQLEIELSRIISIRITGLKRYDERNLAKKMVKDLYIINDPKFTTVVKKHHRLLDSGVALVMYSCYHFAYFSDEPHPKLIMLMDDPEEINYQIYTYSESDIIHEINRIYPQFNIKNKNDVISKIATLVEDDYMSSRKNKDALLNYIHASNGFIDMADKNRKLIPFNWKYVTTNKINTKYLTTSKFNKIASLKIKDCLTKNEMKQGFSKYGWLLNMTIADFVKAFFNKLSNNNHDIEIQLWQVVLDAIQGNKSRRKAIILLGNGSNGKSMYADLIRDIIGIQNIATLTLDQIGANNSQQNFYLGSLVNKTVDIADDAGDGLIMKDDGAFKTIVAGGDLTIAVKNRDNYSTHMSMTIIQPCNVMPNVKKISQAIFDRLLIIPFNHQFNKSGAEKIPANLLETILDNDAIDEYVLYKAVHQPNFDKYHQSKASTQALIKYEDKSDKTRAFAHHFLKWNINRIPVKTTYQLYRQYTKDNGSEPEKFSNFKDEFKQLIKPRYGYRVTRYNTKQVDQLMNLDVKLSQYLQDYYPDVGSTSRSYVLDLPF